jgi:hypothetical protein
VVLIVKKKGRRLQVQYPNFMARYPSGNDNCCKAAFSYRSPSDPYYLLLIWILVLDIHIRDK